MRRNITFSSGDGITIAGHLYRPASAGGGGTHPAILLCQGLSGVKEKVLPAVAEAFSAAGYVVLAFDYCGFGESGDRRPRPYLFPLERAEDAFSALAYLKSLPSVDEDRVGLYGISYGGVTAMYCTALEPTVKAAVFVSSPGGGADFMASLRKKKAWRALQGEIGTDRIRRTRGKPSRLVPLQEVVPFSDCFWKKYKRLDNPDESESIPEAAPGKRNEGPGLSLESAEAMIKFRPDCYAHLLAPRPVLFIHGEKDDVAHLNIIRGIYRKAGPPKRFRCFAGMDHIDLDQGEGLKRQVRLSAKWFDKHLKG